MQGKSRKSRAIREKKQAGIAGRPDPVRNRPESVPHAHRKRGFLPGRDFEVRVTGMPAKELMALAEKPALSRRGCAPR